MNSHQKTEFQIWIHFNSSTDILKLSTAYSSTLDALRNKIVHERPELEGKTLKFIWRGRIIAGNGPFLGVLLRDAILDAQAQQEEGPAVVHIQFSVSEHAAPSAQVEAPQVHRGLDRLLDLGLSRDEVEGLRNQFHAFRGRDLPATGSAEATDAEHLEQLRRQEEAFLENDQSQTMSEDEFSKELLVALMFGFFGGIISTIFMREPGWFSRRG